ncbi:MAG: hypothetical protein ACOYL3_06785 [Desulfuromonadaceae bacterium]
MPESQTKTLIMPINVQDEHFSGFDFGVVELSQSEIDRIRAMSALVKSAKETIHSGAYKIVAWDYVIRVMQTDDDAEELDNDRLPLKEPEYPRIDCPCLNVTDTDFFWSFYPKHTNVNCETATMNIELLDTFDTVDSRELVSENQTEEADHGL